MIIAIDGPAGSGKSTISKLIAEELKFSYLDTGAMFRMITTYFLDNKLDLKKDISLEELKEKISMDIDGDVFYLNGEDVSKRIREDKISKNVSFVSALKNVRYFLLEEQRKISQNRDTILDGRDIGTVVFPNADIKIFLTASPEIRAKRRVEQNEKLGFNTNYEEILKDIIKRDDLDSSREISPLKKANDAIEINSTDFSVLEVKDKIIDLIKENNEI